jgi:hypothetical protein
MKLRTDFVSNSSSSSFIVKKDDNTPDIFREDADVFGFDGFVDRILFRAVFEPFQDAEYSWYTGESGWSCRENNFDIKNVVEVVPDEKFTEMFVGNRYERFVLPECCSEYVAEICDRITAARRIGGEHAPSLYENGKQSKDLMLKWQKDRDRRHDAERDRLQEIYSTLHGRIADLLKRVMGGWEFYQVELGDEDGAEQSGYSFVHSGNVKWYWTFCNH